MGGVEYKIGQYADDTFLTLEKSEESLRTSLVVFNLFEKCSELRANIDKTLVAKLGTKVKEKDLCTDMGLKYVTEFTLLGITFSTVQQSNFEFNIKNKIK